MKSIKFILLLFFISVQTFAFENQVSILQLANEAYQAGDYNKALKQYEQLLEDGYQSADLHYNLGNTFYRLNQLGKAVLHFEKAALIKPRDKDIIYNLEIAKNALPNQLDVIPDFFVSRWWNETQKLLSPTGWGILGLLMLWGAIAGWILWLKGGNRKIRKQGFITGIVLLVLCILPFILGFGAAQKKENSNRAVIMVKQISLKSAPDEVSENLMELHEGTSLIILDEIGEWKKIRLSNGEEGWLENKVLENI